MMMMTTMRIRMVMASQMMLIRMMTMMEFQMMVRLFFTILQKHYSFYGLIVKKDFTDFYFAIFFGKFALQFVCHLVENREIAKTVLRSRTSDLANFIQCQFRGIPSIFEFQNCILNCEIMIEKNIVKSIVIMIVSDFTTLNK